MTINKYFFTTLMTYIFIYLSPVAITFFITKSANPNVNTMLAATAIAYIVGALIMLVQGLFLKRPLTVEKIKTSWPKVILWGIAGIFLAFIAQMAASVIEQLIIHAPLGSENTETIIDMIHFSPLFIINVSIAGPIMEELLFRRAGIGFLSQYISPVLSAGVTSLLFAIAHFDGHIIIYFIMGMTFYFLYQKTGSIWTSIIAHCGMNSLVLLIQLTQ